MKTTEAESNESAENRDKCVAGEDAKITLLEGDAMSDSANVSRTPILTNNQGATYKLIVDTARAQIVESGSKKSKNYYASVEKGSSFIKSVDTVDVHGCIDLKPTTYLETFTHMLKGNIGCGMLAMGMAFKNGGLLLATILTLVIGTVACYNQYVLVEMSDEFQAQYGCGRMGFAKTIKFAFTKGPPLLQKSAKLVGFTIQTFIIVTQIGFCCVYITFVASSLKQILDCYEIYITVPSLMTLALPIFWVTSMIRELKYIAPLSTLANLSTFASLGLIMFGNVQNLPSISERSLIGEWQNIPLCFGTIAYSMEGISLILPLQQNMKKREKFLGTFGVHNVSMGVVVCLLTAMGFFGYYKHGDDVAASLTFNLDIKNIVTQVIVGSLILGIMCSYPLQFFIPIYLLMPWVRRHTTSWPLSKFNLYEYLLRTVLVLVTYLTAKNVPHLDLLISLMGAVGSSFLALIYTPMARLIVMKNRKSWQALVAVLSILIGVSGFFVGTTVSLKEIIAAVLNDHNKV